MGYLITKFSKYSVNEGETYNIDNVFSDLGSEEVYVDIDKIKSLFSFIGDGIYDISPSSYPDHSTGEYTNEVEIEFEEASNGEIPLEEWNEIDNILEPMVGKNGFDDYSINSSHNRITLTFDCTLPLGY
jgi:hypothetical protein